jgi:membrane associated rhomboid family serine protease
VALPFTDPVRGVGVVFGQELAEKRSAGAALEPAVNAGTVLAVTTDVQTCYRHADRRAGVRCQRCDRPICPECMQAASVGFHCPECARRGRQRVYSARSLQRRSDAVVTVILVAVNAVVYLASTVADGGSPGGGPSFEFQLDWALVGQGLIPGTTEVVGVAAGEWYRLVTGGFLHAGLMHLGFNMFALWILGRQLEPIIGRASFVAVYMSSMLAGSLGVMLVEPGSLTVGASGAVFGLFGYALVLQWSRGVNPMDTGLGAIILLNLVFTFAVPGISIGGHVGGLVGGAVAGALHDVVRPRLGLPAWTGPVLVAAFGLSCALAAVTVV